MSCHRRDRHRRARARGKATDCAGSCRGRRARRDRRCHTPRSRRCGRSQRLRPTPAGPSCRLENERAGRYQRAAPPDPAREGAFQPWALVQISSVSNHVAVNRHHRSPRRRLGCRACAPWQELPVQHPRISHATSCFGRSRLPCAHLWRQPAAGAVVGRLGHRRCLGQRR
jgi:hypothetical protein